MKKKSMSITVATLLTLNSFQMALAADPAGAKQKATLAVSKLDANFSDEQIESMLKEGDPEVANEILKMKGEVDELIQKLKALNLANESDKFLKVAGVLDLILISTSAYTMHAHINSDEATKIRLSINVASVLLHKLVQVYKENHRLDAKVIGEKIFETSNEVSKMDKIPSEILRVKTELNNMSIELMKNKGALENAADNMGMGDNIAIGISLGYLILHLAYPKLAHEADGVAKVVLPKFYQTVIKASQVGKTKGVAYGSAATISLPDVVRMAAGISSEQSQDIISRTLINLDSTAAKINADLANAK